MTKGIFIHIGELHVEPIFRSVARQGLVALLFFQCISHGKHHVTWPKNPGFSLSLRKIHFIDIDLQYLTQSVLP